MTSSWFVTFVHNSSGFICVSFCFMISTFELHLVWCDVLQHQPIMSYILTVSLILVSPCASKNWIRIIFGIVPSSSDHSNFLQIPSNTLIIHESPSCFWIKFVQSRYICDGFHPYAQSTFSTYGSFQLLKCPKDKHRPIGRFAPGTGPQNLRKPNEMKRFRNWQQKKVTNGKLPGTPCSGSDCNRNWYT